MRVPLSRSMAAAIAATVAVVLVMAPAVAVFVTHPIPPGLANAIMILIPNLILAVVIWAVVFLGARAIFRH